MRQTRPQTPPPESRGRPHPRNRHGDRYDFVQLVQSCPELARFVIPHPCGGDTINFSDPGAVKTLNRALLKFNYGVTHWDIPPGNLCPPIPSRADYIHHLADLLADGNSRTVPQGPAVKILDIGVGANCVYPIIGAAEYGWRFVGTDIDPASIDWARKLIAANRGLTGKIECRLQPTAAHIFEGVIEPSERFTASMCNPPFHASPQEAAAESFRKVKNLGSLARKEEVVLNFGGKSTELWCEGGEAGFVRRMILQSAQRREQFLWFTTLVSKRGSLPAIYRTLKTTQAEDVRTIAMAQGQKQSRLVAWTYLTAAQRAHWRS